MVLLKQTAECKNYLVIQIKKKKLNRERHRCLQASNEAKKASPEATQPLLQYSYLQDAWKSLRRIVLSLWCSS